MPRRRLTLLVLAAVLLTAGVAPLPRPGVASAAEARKSGDSLEDLLMDLQVIPLDHVAPRAFTLETLDGGRLALADVKGPALLYFWATW